MNSTQFQTRYGKWALVAGASLGLGEAFAEQIAAKGINVALVARRTDLLDQLQTKFTATYGVQVRTIPLDLARDDATAVLETALADVQVGLMVYNAGFSAIGPFLDRPLEDHLTEIATNCRTPVSLAYTFGKKMRSRGHGGMILMSSLSSLQGSAYISNYAATKAYNALLGEGLWEELRHSGVDVLACCSGAVNTPNYLESLPGGAQKGAPMGAMTPQAVVAETLAALGTRPSFFPGVTNKASAFVMRRLMPHGLAVRIMGRVMRSIYDFPKVGGGPVSH